MGQLELANVPLEGWIIDPVVHGILDGPYDGVHLLAQCIEGVHPNVMACGGGMAIDGARGQEMLLEHFPKGPCKFPYVLLITLQPVTYTPVDYFTFCVMFSLSLGATMRFLMVLPSLKWTWNTILPQFFTAFS